MAHFVVDISQDGFYLKKHRGLLEVYEGDDRKAQLPIDDILSVIITAQQATLSKNIMVELAQNQIPIILCGHNYMPASMVLPANLPPNSLGHPLKQAQAVASLNSRLWQQIVTQKIQNQYHLASLVAPNHIHLNRLKWLAENVKSNDNQKHEGEAAKLYFPIIFNESFKRDPNLEGKNSQLNYGYAILRAMAARAICSAGLSPALGIFHKNLRNGFCLADDLMEPYRPLVDKITLTLNNDDILTPQAKQQLTAITHINCQTPKGQSPLYLVLQDLAYQLAKIYNQQQQRLNIYDWW